MQYTKKRLYMYIFTGIMIISGFVFQQPNNLAEANQIQGIYVFTDSKPVAKYKYLGTVSVSIGLSTQYQSIRDRLIKKAKNDYPEAEGIIIDTNAGGADRADVVRF
jgi:hypothetical protein